MANAKCRICCRAADAGPYCGKCAADIMAKALNHFFGERRRKLPPSAAAQALRSLFIGSLGRVFRLGSGRRTGTATTGKSG